MSLDVARARPASFRADVVPLLSKAGCNMGACHGNLSGKGGFRLSLRGEDPDFDYGALTRDQLGRRIDRLEPGRSLIVLKPTGGLAHEGGQRFSRHSIEAASLIRWIASGARDDGPSSPKVKRLRIFPADRVTAPGETAQQLVVTAELEDGSTRDVTRQAAYDLSDPTRFEVTVDGLVHARGPGEATIAVRYRNGRATSRLAFPADRPGFAWRGGERRAPGRPGRLCQAPGPADQSLAAGRRSGLPPPGLSRRHRPAPRSVRDARASSPMRTPRSGASWSTAWWIGPSSPTSGR